MNSVCSQAIPQIKQFPDIHRHRHFLKIPQQPINIFGPDYSINEHRSKTPGKSQITPMLKYQRSEVANKRKYERPNHKVNSSLDVEGIIIIRKTSTF